MDPNPTIGGVEGRGLVGGGRTRKKNGNVLLLWRLLVDLTSPAVMEDYSFSDGHCFRLLFTRLSVSSMYAPVPKEPEHSRCMKQVRLLLPGHCQAHATTALACHLLSV